MTGLADAVDTPLPRIDPPGPGEYAPFYAGYIGRIAPDDLPALLADQVARLAAVCLPLGDDGALRRYAPEKWSVKQLLGHLADAERVFAYRLLRVSRGDQTPLTGFDEVLYVEAAGFEDRPLAGLLDDLAAARLATLSLIRSTPPAAWANVGVANDAPVSARALAYIIAGHFEHHRAVLRERYGVDGR